MDDEDSEDAEGNIPTDAAETMVGVAGPEDHVVIRVEKVEMLLEDGLVFVVRAPVVFEGAFGMLDVGGVCCSRDA